MKLYVLGCDIGDTWFVIGVSNSRSDIYRQKRGLEAFVKGHSPNHMKANLKVKRATAVISYDKAVRQ